MTLVNPPINPVSLEGYPYSYRPYSDVTSFSYRTGATFQETLESIRAWLPDVLIPYMTANFNQLDQSVVDDVNQLADSIDEALATQADTVNTALSSQSSAITQALTDQQRTVNTQLANTLAQLAGGSIEIVDPAIAAVAGNATSQTRAVLDGLYAAKSAVDALVTLTGTGRLSKTSLDAAYTTTDAQVAAFASNPTSQTRSAFAAAFQKIQMQVSGGYIQFRYQGDTSWQNLIATSSLTGPRGLEGEQGNPGGAAELDYAETLTTVDVPAGSSSTTVPGVTLSFTMPARPVMLKIGCIARFIATSGNDGAIQLVETTGGGSTIIAEAHTGYSAGTSDYKQVLAQRRITGTAGQVRTFKLQCRQVSGVAWSVNAATAFPAWIAAHEC